MLGFGKKTALVAGLGRLESEVMTALWAQPEEASVRELLPRLGRSLAYTTVMTTLDRLYKKGLLTRRKAERAFVYRPSCSREEWQSRRAGEAVREFLTAPGAAHGAVLATLVEAVGPGQEPLLAALEAKIRAHRSALRAAEAGRTEKRERPAPAEKSQ
jgi:predicted transcriptional regulator